MNALAFPMPRSGLISGRETKPGVGPAATEGGLRMLRFLLGLAVSSGLVASALAQAPTASAAKPAVATFAGGCFWCVEADFDKVDGVISTTSGYIGGKTVNPTYQQVVSGSTGHAEAVEIAYDPAKVSFAKLLEVFWRNIDPLVKDRQFCDSGSQYRSAIFFHGEEQRKLAEDSKTKVAAKFSPRRVYTEIVPAGTFYKAEDYHQDYYTKNPLRYKFYRLNCGRDNRLEELWGKSDKSS
jgi:peptide-methionine (S)-S-oxide reductase